MSLNSRINLSHLSEPSVKLKNKNRSVFSSIISTDTSVGFGNVTASFNNQLNDFLKTLNAKRVTDSLELQEQLALNSNYKGMRDNAIKLAWEYEQANVMMGGKGTVDGGWSSSEIQQIKSTGKPKVYDPYYNEIRTPEGHHINNVSDHPELQANPDNIKMYRYREDHVEEGHHGNVNNSSEGSLIDRNANLIQTNRNRVIRNELQGIAVSAGIGFGTGFTLSMISELALKGFSSVNISELMRNSTISGLETAFLSTIGYGIGRCMTTALSNIGIDITTASGQMLNYSVVGLSTITFISLYQYAKLKRSGTDSKTALTYVGKQSLVSLSTLGASFVAQGIFGGCAGIMTSATIGILYFGYHVHKMISSKEREEKLRVNTIIAYKDLVLNQ